MRTLRAACLAMGTLTGLSGQMQVTKPTERSTVITRRFAAPRQKVFDALTQADQVAHWFRPKQMSLVSYETDVKVGGSFRYVFQRPSGKRLEMRGVFQEMDAPRRWVHTETYDFSPLALVVTVTLEDTHGKTVMSQTILYASKEERDGDFDAVAGSAAEIYTGLDEYLK